MGCGCVARQPRRRLEANARTDAGVPLEPRRCTDDECSQEMRCEKRVAHGGGRGGRVSVGQCWWTPQARPAGGSKVLERQRIAGLGPKRVSASVRGGFVQRNFYKMDKYSSLQTISLHLVQLYEQTIVLIKYQQYCDGVQLSTYRIYYEY